MYSETQSHEVERDGNIFTLPASSSTYVVGNLLKALHEGIGRGYSDFVLDFQNVAKVYPNVYTPIAGILEFYRNEYVKEISFDFDHIPPYVHNSGILQPRTVETNFSIIQPFDNVWRFSNDHEVHALVNAYLKSVERAATCEPGVLQGLEWCLNEVMDNVLQHAETSHGYVMGQIHQQTQRIAICIYDHGRGIYNSLKNSKYLPNNAVDAITIALQEGVTRDKAVGQGNGMWGLHNIVYANSGSLNITSGSGYFGMSGGDPKTSSSVPFLSRENNCTTVDFQIDFKKTISIPDALGGHEPCNFRIENLEDENDNIIYRLADQPSGTGTRRSGEAIRNEILNIMNQSESLIVLDFNGVSILSSSFSDELLGKLIVKVGFITFNQFFRLTGMNKTVQAIANRSIMQRLSVGTQIDDDSDED